MGRIIKLLSLFAQIIITLKYYLSSHSFFIHYNTQLVLKACAYVFCVYYADLLKNYLLFKHVLCFRHCYHHDLIPDYILLLRSC